MQGLASIPFTVLSGLDSFRGRRLVRAGPADFSGLADISGRSLLDTPKLSIHDAIDENAHFFTLPPCPRCLHDDVRMPSRFRRGQADHGCRGAERTVDR